MATVRWIKIVTDIFDDEKVLMIESLPNADSILVIWFKLLCLAGKTNNSGVFMFNDRLPYSDEMFAAIFRRELKLVRIAMNTFEQFGMIEVVDNVVTIPNWSKHQSLDAYEKRKERDRLYQAERRAAQRALVEKSSDTSADKSSDIAPLDIDKDIDKEEDIKSSLLSEAETAPDPNPPAPAPFVVISITLNDKTEYPITEADVAGWKDLYPAVDIMQELRKMKGWADANPTKRKTKNGIKRFINSWLSKEQDKFHPTGGGQHGVPQGTAPGTSQKYGRYV